MDEFIYLLFYLLFVCVMALFGCWENEGKNKEKLEWKKKKKCKWHCFGKFWILVEEWKLVVGVVVFFWVIQCWLVVEKIKEERMKNVRDVWLWEIGYSSWFIYLFIHVVGLLFCLIVYLWYLCSKRVTWLSVCLLRKLTKRSGYKWW